MTATLPAPLPGPVGTGTDGVALLLTALTLVLGWLALRELLRERAEAARVRRLSGHPSTDRSDWPQRAVTRLEAWAARTPPGRALADRLRLAGLPAAPVALCLAVTATATLAALAVSVVLPRQAAWAAAVATAVLAWLGLRWRRGRRGARFRTQLPDVADVLANLSSAGLALPSAVHSAVDELDDPARSELANLREMIAVGNGVERSLQRMADRLPSRDLTVLVGTMAIQMRGGGDVVEALRSVAVTLRRRQELQREIDTALASAKANSVAIAILGVVVLAMLNTLGDGVGALFTHPVGLVALSVAVLLVTVGGLLIARTVRIEV